ncbi:MAG: FkbM family methyltransferase [Pseudomonadota bacterium]
MERCEQLDMSKHARKEIYSLQIEGVDNPPQMRVHTQSDLHVSTAIASNGIWEPLETYFLLAMLRPGDVFVDVGANIGYFSLLASQRVGAAGAVLAFEPEADNFALLQTNREINQCDNLRCFQLALGRRDSEAKLFLNERNRGDHSLYSDGGSGPSQSIRVANGSRFIGDQYQRINFLKVDTQGAECDVLWGLGDLIHSSADDLVMIIEVSPMHLRRAGASSRELLDLIDRESWRLYLMDEQTQGLLPMSRDEVRSLCDITEQDPQSEGFFNLVVAGRSIENNSALRFVRDWGMFENALAYFLLSQRLQDWDGSLRQAHSMENHLYLAYGWAFPEDWGRWSLGRKSCIKFKPSPELALRSKAALKIRGRYFGEVEPTAVRINGADLGNYDLSKVAVDLPRRALDQEYVYLEFLHRSPLKPADVGDSSDQREIKFGLESIAIE